MTLSIDWTQEKKEQLTIRKNIGIIQNEHTANKELQKMNKAS